MATENTNPALAHLNLNPVQKRVINKLFVRIIIFFFILYLFAFLDRINISFAGLTMGQSLGLTATEFSIAASLCYIAYAVCGVPSNMMLGFTGAKRLLGSIMVGWGVCSTCTMFAQGALSLYVLRVLVGVFEAGFLPAILVYLTYWFPAYFRARANALFMISLPVTMVLGSIISGYILELDGVMDLYGWQWLFLVEGIPCVLLGLAIFVILSDTPDDAKWLTDEERKTLKDMIDQDKLELVQAGGGKSLKAAEPHALAQKGVIREVFSPVIIAYILVYFFMANSLAAVSIWGPQLVKSFSGPELPPSIIGLLFAIPSFCTVVWMVLWCRSSDLKQERKVHSILLYVLGALGWAMIAMPASPVVQLIGLCIASSCVFTALALFWTTPDQNLSEKSKALGIAVINTLGSGLGSACGPMIIGILYDLTQTHTYSYYSMGLMLLVSAVIFIFIPIKRSRPRASG